MLVCVMASTVLLSGAPGTYADTGNGGGDNQALRKIGHIIVIYQENWSFDSLYGQFPGVNGLANAFDTLPQLDKNTNYTSYIYQTPQAKNNGAPDVRFPPANGHPALPLIPYNFTDFAGVDQKTGDIIHRFYHEQLQIDNGVLEPSAGSMDKFVTWSDNGGLVLSYVNATDLPEGKLAQKYVICDNFFHSAYGGSFLNHQYLVAATAPAWNQALPASNPNFVSNWNPATKALNDGNLTFDGKFAVNTTFTVNTPHPSTTPADQLMLNLSNPTIGDRLSDKHVSWKWYSGGWNDAVAGHADPLFQYHHQPLAYFQNYADGTPGRAAHLKDEQDFFGDLTAGTLPAVSFIKPLGPDNEHPGYADLQRGQQHVADLVNAVKNSQYWKDCAIIITYDENGGRWDHVMPPPMPDGWGLGTRVPAIIVSPFAKRGFVDSTPYETVSILKFIEHRFDLPPLAVRDANSSVNDLSNAFSFSDDHDGH